ncbi:DUF6206 family protein [Streptomyces sp. AC495_CC817]|uniref:DUF6206 family protein n=1 Tax=Streptomyces sp. AC495_CC817 TaxID=2823900 RepID=UPI001C2702D0|nr:DUF6206 family protein [Streptomyces sp. AC495_CC817]
MSFVLPERDIAALERRVQRALDTADPSALAVLGFGEVTLVLRLDTPHGSFACKRLPVFPSYESFRRHESLVGEYIEQLEKAGVRVAETRLWHTRTPSGKVVGYCVQQALPGDRLCSRLLHTEGDAWAGDFYARFLALVEKTVTHGIGLDAQASNWMDLDGELVYLDVTTPLLRDARRRERLDVRLFFTSLPWILRDAVRVSQTRAIFDKYYEPRGAVLDFLGNLHKERLSGLIPGFLAQSEGRFDAPVTADEVAGYYREDARMWELIQRLRRADRFWHRRIRRRTYPFLLPPDVDR